LKVHIISFVVEYEVFKESFNKHGLQFSLSFASELN
jgi:hypothetical protein